LFATTTLNLPLFNVDDFATRYAHKTNMLFFQADECHSTAQQFEQPHQLLGCGLGDAPVCACGRSQAAFLCARCPQITVPACWICAEDHHILVHLASDVKANMDTDVKLSCSTWPINEQARKAMLQGKTVLRWMREQAQKGKTLYEMSLAAYRHLALGQELEISGVSRKQGEHFALPVNRYGWRYYLGTEPEETLGLLRLRETEQHDWVLCQHEHCYRVVVPDAAHACTGCQVYVCSRHKSDLYTCFESGCWDTFCDTCASERTCEHCYITFCEYHMCDCSEEDDSDRVAEDFATMSV
jgi:hypothetical protein